MWGALLGAGLQIGSSLLGNEAGKKEAGKQNRLLSRYNNAFNDYSHWSEDNDTRQQGEQSALSYERYRDLQGLADALGSKDRTQAGQAGGATRRAMIDAAAAPRRAATAVTGAPHQAKWGAMTRGNAAPVMDARRRLLEEQAQQDAMDSFDNSRFNQLAQQQTDTGRRSAESTRRGGLMQGFLDRGLAKDANAYRYNGPSNSFYNAQLASQLMSLAGTATMSGAANRK